MDVESTPRGGPFRPSRSKTRRHGKRSDGYVGEAGFSSSVINLANTIIGSGMLAMPLAMARMGITLGVSVIIWSGITAGFGLYLQARCAKYLDRGGASFFALAQITYPNASVIFDAAIAVKCFGVGVSYLIIIGDLMPGVIQGFGFGNGADYLADRHFWVTAFMLVIIPLSFLKRLDSLKYTSVVALVSIGYLVILVVYHFLKNDTIKDPSPIRLIAWEGFIPALSSFPVIVFAYTCHQNMFSILNELADTSHSSTTGVITTSIGASGASYVLTAVTGYLSFGNSVSGNIVSMYPPALSSTIARAAIVVLVMFSVPLQVHPCRSSVDAVMKWRPKKSASSSPTGSGNASAAGSPHRHPLLPPRQQHSQRGTSAAGARTQVGMSDTKFAVLTTIILVLSYVTSMTVSSLEAVLAYVGSTGSTAISFILPGLFYYKISAPDSIHHQRLLKEDDDEVNPDSDSEEEDDDGGLGPASPQSAGAGVGSYGSNGLLSPTSPSGSSPTQYRRSSGYPRRHPWRRMLLRKLSLGLAIYGIIVMIVCLTINTFFIASH